MVSIIHGGKGSGKTKRIIDATNAAAQSAKGCVVYMTDKPEHSLQIDNSVRFIGVKEYGIAWECCLAAFIKGLLAGNADIQKIYIDGLARFLELPADKLEKAFDELEKISEFYKVDFTVTFSADELPKFMKKYI